MPKQLFFLVFVPVLFILIGGGCSSAKYQADDTFTPTETTADKPPVAADQLIANNNSQTMEFNSAKQYIAKLITTEGEIEIELHKGQTPNTVKNFVDLASKNFYDGTIFHRVISGFMIQGGDPLGNGTGGPGYKFDDEPFEGDYSRGTVAMANSGPNTNGSQFFIMHADYALPKNYTIFGKVTKGLEVVDKIASAPVQAGGGGEPSQPVSPVTVTKVEVSEQ
jgi:cyclophilin family peptidyl-prolyl cis-trans isomerase